MATKRDKHAHKLGRRDWRVIAEEWMNYIPSPLPDAPAHEVEELASLIEFYDAVGALPLGEPEFVDEIDGLRQAVLLDAIAQLQRAVNVIQAAEFVGAGGYRSWSRAVYYQSAFFAMRAIVGMLGCIVLRERHTNKVFQFDIWAAHDEGRKRRPTDPEFRIRIHCRAPPGHGDYWSLFNRLICATSVPDVVWPWATIDPIKTVLSESIPVQRNRLHYRSTYWPFDDMKARLPSNEALTAVAALRSRKWTLPAEHEDFGLEWGLAIVDLALALFRGLSTKSPALEAEYLSLVSQLQSTAWYGQGTVC